MVNTAPMEVTQGSSGETIAAQDEEFHRQLWEEWQKHKKQQSAKPPSSTATSTRKSARVRAKSSHPTTSTDTVSTTTSTSKATSRAKRSTDLPPPAKRLNMSYEELPSTTTNTMITAMSTQSVGDITKITSLATRETTKPTEYVIDKKVIDVDDPTPIKPIIPPVSLFESQPEARRTAQHNPISLRDYKEQLREFHRQRVRYHSGAMMPMPHPPLPPQAFTTLALTAERLMKMDLDQIKDVPTPIDFNYLDVESLRLPLPRTPSPPVFRDLGPAVIVQPMEQSSDDDRQIMENRGSRRLSMNDTSPLKRTRQRTSSQRSTKRRTIRPEGSTAPIERHGPVTGVTSIAHPRAGH